MAREIVVLTLDRDIDTAPQHKLFGSEVLGDRRIEIAYDRRTA
jgi:hypothetical protein